MSKYHAEILNKNHFIQVVNLITHAFCDHEPMTKYLGIAYEEFIPFAELMVQKAIQDQLSVVILDKKKVIACSIVEDIADPLDISTDIDPRFKFIFTLLEHLGTDFFTEKHFSKGHLSHLFITAVHEQYHGQGLSRKINFESIKLARERAYDFMCCEFTHHYNEHGTIKNLENGSFLINRCRYKDFVFDNKKPFESLEGEASAFIWELRPQARLQYHIKVQKELDIQYLNTK